MLHFVAGVYSSLFTTTEYNVLIVGRECAGKSTLLEQLKYLYNPATQEQLSSSANLGPNGHGLDAEGDGSTSLKTDDRPGTSTARRSTTTSLPPGTPQPATAVHMAQKRIRPTVGLNYAVVQHRFSPPVAVVTRVKKSLLPSHAVSSLPPPPEDVLAAQRTHQREVLANAPSDAVTRVVLRDLGGQAALRDLWEKYYPQSQALVYVVDSTLPFRTQPHTSASPAAASADAAGELLPAPRDHFTLHELEELYKPDRQLLARLLQHPLLHGVPVLLLSNKTDAVQHVPLGTLQNALRLAELATDPAFYLLRNGGADDGEDGGGARPALPPSESSRRGSRTGEGTAPPAAPLSRHCARAEAAQRRVGESGFGEIALRVAEVSALDGAGVAGAMDWMVAQLLYRARDVDTDA